MKITVIGTGYVGLVTGVCFAEVGYDVTCFDVDKQKIQMLSQGVSPIYEPGLEEMLATNISRGRIRFTANAEIAYEDPSYIFIAVGTPEQKDGSADLDFLYSAVRTALHHVQRDTVLIIKSTVPVGTNERMKKWIQESSNPHNIHVVSNPEFIREGSGILDTFHGDRVVIGADDPEISRKVAQLYDPFNMTVLETDVHSAELIKYASNAFLATKISFINEVSNLCELTGANIEDVALGMGMDDRIGSQFLKAGIGYGGSCFPKDTKALEKLTEYYQYDFKILRSVIDVNHRQKQQLLKKAKERFGSLKGLRTAILGLSFKPHTDDIREAPSLDLIANLIAEEAGLSVYDPAAMGRVEEIFGQALYYADSIDDAIDGADVVFILTEWPEIKEYNLENYQRLMHRPVIFDGRNCYSLESAKDSQIAYISIGRKPVHENKIALNCSRQLK